MWCERNSPANPVKKITVYVDNDNMDIKGKKSITCAKTSIQPSSQVTSTRMQSATTCCESNGSFMLT